VVESFDHLDQAIHAAQDFIESRRSPDGLWRDFMTLAGPSSEWVSGFVIYARSRCGARDERDLDALKQLLSRQRRNGGWSYNETVPADCDSTAWVMMAISTAPVWRPSAVRHASQYIARHNDESTGGFSTYSESDRVDRFIRVSDQEVTRGWLSSHPCVTAAAMQSLLVHGEPADSEIVKNAARYLNDQRDDLGLWASYWWKGFGYSTYQALKTLTMVRAIDIQQAKETIQYLVSQQRKDGGWSDSDSNESEVFATSFILLALLLFPDSVSLAAAGNGIAWLLRNQRKNGGWPTAPILRIPPPMVKEPETVARWRIDELGTGVIIEDPCGIFTSSSALWAFSIYKSMTA
jgi:hypothetical protein